jgi:hypothetical protein
LLQALLGHQLQELAAAVVRVVLVTAQDKTAVAMAVLLVVVMVRIILAVAVAVIECLPMWVVLVVRA